MKSTIGIYDSHDKALEAVKELKDSGYPIEKVSLVGRAEIIDDHLHVNNNPAAVQEAEVSVGIAAGSIIGILSGIGIFAIPGLGFLYGAGALVGAFAGLEVGVIAGGLTAILTKLGMKKEHAVKYDEHLKEGKFLVVAQGDEAEIETAKRVLHEHGTHTELSSH
jgi:hypothetical protein